MSFIEGDIEIGASNILANADLPIDDRRNLARSGQRRAHPRFTVVWTGQILSPSRSFDLVILNISASGAKLHGLKTMELATHFTLVVDKLGSFPAELVWRNGSKAGIKFLGDAAASAKTFSAVLPLTDSLGD